MDDSKHVGERVSVRPAGMTDASAIADIFNYFVRETVVTFQEEPLSAEEFVQRLHEVEIARLPWLVAEEAGRVLGFAYASPWKSRSAYRFSVEVTVYLAPDQTGRGLGSKLYGELLRVLQSLHMHTAIGGIALPNDASVALHEKFGFHRVAHFKEVGFKFGRWIDVGYWQRTL